MNTAFSNTLEMAGRSGIGLFWKEELFWQLLIHLEKSKLLTIYSISKKAVIWLMGIFLLII